MDSFALFEADLDQGPGNLAAHDDIVVGDHGADAAQVNRHGSVLDLGRDHRRRVFLLLCGRLRGRLGAGLIANR